MRVDDLHAGPGISSQRQQIDALPVQQAESDGRVPQAVHRAWLPVRIEFVARHIQHPVEHDRQHIQGVVAVFQFGQKEVIVRVGLVAGPLVLNDLSVNAHRRKQCDDGRIVFLVSGSVSLR